MNVATCFTQIPCLMRLAVLLLLCLGGLAPATAQSQERLFTILNVPVDEQARTAVEARRAGLLAAQAAAFRRLTRKLVQPDDFNRIPALSADEVEPMVDGISIKEERSSSNRYVALLNVKFNNEAVSEFLNFIKVPHVRSAGQPVILLHAHRKGLETRLLNSDDKVVAARAAQDLENRIRVYRTLPATQENRQALSRGAVYTLSESAARTASTREGGDDVLLARTTWTWDGRLSYAYRLFEDGAGAVVGVIDAGMTEGAALERFYQIMLDDIDTRWRSSLLVGFDQLTTESFAWQTQEPMDFSAVSQVLTKIALVEQVTVEEVAVPLSALTVTYRGTREQLRLTLRAQGLTLVPYGDRYLLTRASNDLVSQANKAEPDS